MFSHNIEKVYEDVKRESFITDSCSIKYYCQAIIVFLNVFLFFFTDFERLFHR